MTTERQVDASSNPGVDSILLTPTATLDIWVASTAYSVGDCIVPTSSNGFRYTCTIAGTSDSSEPTFPTVGIGSTVVDNTVTWALTAAEHPTTEVTLATSSAGLDTATAGAALNMGTTILSEVANEVEIHIRIINTVTTVSNNATCPELGLLINEIIETVQ